jgi:uncharacterized protein with GYD domain
VQIRRRFSAVAAWKHWAAKCGFYATLGEYDYVACVEAPNEAVVMRFLLAMGSAGDVRTTTMKALARAEFDEIARKL